MEKFAGALRPEEIRSAVLLGLLSVVIYPLLPDQFVDKWDLVNPRRAWVIVVVIASIGTWCIAVRLYDVACITPHYGRVGQQHSVTELAQLLGGTEVAAGVIVAVLILTNVAMFLRNLAILCASSVRRPWRMP